MELDAATYDFWTTVILTIITAVCVFSMLVVRKDKGLLPFLVLALYASIVLLVGYNEYQYTKYQEETIMEELGYFDGVIEPGEQEDTDPDIWIDSESTEGARYEIIDEETRQRMKRSI